MLANISDFLSSDLLSAGEMLDLDRWIVAKAGAIQAQNKGYYDNYEFHLVIKNIMVFCTYDLGGFYLGYHQR